MLVHLHSEIGRLLELGGSELEETVRALRSLAAQEHN
jgi:hypothetical protein